MRLKTLFLAVSVLLLQNYLYAQDKSNVKFGKVEPEDFDLSAYKFDTSAGAVYIADIGSSEFEGNNSAWFSLYFKRQMRIKILNKNGFDAATMIIPVYVNGSDEEKIEKLRAVTYNLENGKVVQTRLEEKSIFKDKINRNLSYKKFTMPAVKEGSIVEISYTIKSDFIFNLQPWAFQGEYPRLWSEYTVGIPECFNYVFLAQGYLPFHIKKQDVTYKSYSFTKDNMSSGSDHFTMKANVSTQRWVMKDVPPLKEENFITSLKNYVAKVEFQLSEYREPLTPKTVMSDWNKVSSDLMKSENFGEPLTKVNNWLDDDIRQIVGNTKDKLEKARRIYAFVQNNFTCTDYSEKYLSNPLRTVFKNKNGTVADINLLLIAMLRHEDINAEPVLLSTRGHGLTHEVYPLMDRFNYVVAGVLIGDAEYYLDATEPRLGFGKLPIRCYNGHARFISLQSPDPVYFSADSIRETKMTTVFMSNGDDGKLLSSVSFSPGYYESHGIRTSIAEKGKAQFVKNITSAFPAECVVADVELDSLDNTDMPLQVRYNVDFAPFTEDIEYFNPMVVEGYKDNYFKAAQRYYPVEMPYAFDDVFLLNMEVPKGYVVDELPKSAKVNFNDTEGSFEYMISNTGSSIMLRSRVRLNKASFTNEDYENLRGFFDYIVKKHAEQIVFKKKK